MTLEHRIAATLLGTSLAFALACVLPACAPPTPVPDHASEQPPTVDPQGPTNGVAIPPTVRSNLGITFTTVEARHVAQTIRVPGAFELRPLARHEYRMALPGRVELLVDQYDAIEAGQPLFRFRSTAWPELLHEIVLGEQDIETALAEITVAEARITEARSMLTLTRDRIAALAQADFKKVDLDVQAAELEASLPRLQAELQLAQTRLANARRTREHALHRAATAAGIPEGQLEMEVPVDGEGGGEQVPRYRTIDWIEVRATERGIVEALYVTDGAFVEPPTTVLAIVDPDQVRFRALALQGDLVELLDAVEARIVPARSPGMAIGESVGATMTIGLEAHPEERTMTLLAIPDALRPWVRPGVSAFLEVVVASTEAPELAIPRSSIVQDGLEHVFFRRDPSDPNRVLRVEADMGVDDGRWVVLYSGVMRGDEVVVSGAYELKLATARRSTDAPSGHVHADGSVHDDH